MTILKEDLAKNAKLSYWILHKKILIHQFIRINMSDPDTFQHWKQKSLILQNKDFCFRRLNVSGPDWLIRINWLIHRFYVKSRLKCKDKIFKLILANMAASCSKFYLPFGKRVLMNGSYSEWQIFGITIIRIDKYRVMRWIWDLSKYHNSHSSKSIRVTELCFGQIDLPRSTPFWQKKNLITPILFELWLLWYLAQSQIHRITL